MNTLINEMNISDNVKIILEIFNNEINNLKTEVANLKTDIENFKTKIIESETEAVINETKLKVSKKNNVRKQLVKKVISNKNYCEDEKKTHRQTIIKKFNDNVRGKSPDTTESNTNHNGKVGHWLEKMMEIEHNASNSPDIYGYEMKKGSLSKISFGDWTPDIGPTGKDLLDEQKWWTNDEKKINFMEKYALYNEANERWSWSKQLYFGKYNNNGQKFVVDANNIFVVYNKTMDTYYENREDINKQQSEEDIKLFGWSNKLLKKRVEDKFGKNGYFICKQNKKKIFINIIFYERILFDEFLKSIKDGSIYLDPGTKMGENRPYMSWRASTNWWEKRICYNVNEEENYEIDDLETTVDNAENID